LRIEINLKAESWKQNLLNFELSAFSFENAFMPPIMKSPRVSYFVPRISIFNPKHFIDYLKKRLKARQDTLCFQPF